MHPILRIVVRSITYFYARHAPIILMHYTTGQLEKTEKLAITHTYKHRYSNNQKWKTPKKRERVALYWKYCVQVYVVVSSYHVPLDVHIYLYLFYNVLQSRVYYLLSAFYRLKTTNDYYWYTTSFWSRWCSFRPVYATGIYHFLFVIWNVVILRSGQ